MNQELRQDQFQYQNSDKRKNKLYLKPFLLFIFLITIFLFISFPSVLAQYSIGSTVSDFALTGLDDEKYQLNQFKNKYDYILLYFLESNNSEETAKIWDLHSYFKENEPSETYQIIVIVMDQPDEQNRKEYFIDLSKKLQLPFLFLWDEQAKVTNSYGIEKFPAALLLKGDLSVRRVYSNLSGRAENSFYQYLNFAFTPKKKSESSGCEGGVCPPPPGF